MRESTRYVLGFATIWPLLFFIIFMLFIVSLFINPPFDNVAPGETVEIPTDFIVMIVLNVATSLLSLGLMIFYIVHVVKSDELTKDRKVLWAVGLLLATPIVMPIYFYIYFWREPEISHHAPYGLHHG